MLERHMPLNHLHPYRRVRFNRNRLVPLVELPRRPLLITAVLLTAYWLPIAMMFGLLLSSTQRVGSFAPFVLLYLCFAAVGFLIFVPRLWPPQVLAFSATLFDTCMCSMPIVLHANEITPGIKFASYLSVVCWLVVIISAVLYRRAMRHHPVHCCQACGYDMQGHTASDPCPECGMPRRAAT